MTYVPGTDPEPTQQLPVGTPPPSYYAPQNPFSASPPPPRPPRRGAFVASVLAATLVVGGAAGVGGAAAWNEWGQESGGDTSSGSPTASPIVDQGDTQATEGSAEEVAANVLPSVVKIDVSGASGAGSGSGIVISSDGMILTNNHVVEVAADGGALRVSFNDGSHADATIVGRDPLTDTAVIKVEGVDNLTPATIGESANLDVGQQVVAIGSPFGLASTVTTGIVSALNRPVNVGSDAEGNATTYPAIQTDAAINPGNSGGPLVDMTGALVGINSSIRTATDSSSGGQAGSIGLGFAIPIDEVMPIVKQMIDGETPTHARLGVGVENVSATEEEPFATDGAAVTQVSEGTGAQEAGLETGDVVTKVDGQIITGADSLVATIRSYRPGDKVEVTWVRNGETMTANITLDSDGE
jgi:putative serine protease PepD